jgi:DNA replication protein DnaC
VWRDVLSTDPCSRWTEHVLRTRLEQSGVPRLLLGATFESFHARTGAARLALASAREFAGAVVADRSRLTPHSLYVDGPTGVGKSHLAAAAVRVVTAAGLRASFNYVPTLLELIRRSASIYGQAAALQVDRIQSADLLVLDDLGVERPGSDFIRERLEALVHERTYGALATLVTTNVKVDVAEDRLGASLIRRLAPHVVFLDGEPYTGE